MNDELKGLSKLINRRHWFRARLLAARLAHTKLGESAHFWFQVALLASLINNQELCDVSIAKMIKCTDYQPIMKVDRVRDTGLAQLRHGNVETAAKTFEEAFEELSKVAPEDFNRMAMHQMCIGLVEAALNNYPKSIAAFRRAIGIWTEIGHWAPTEHSTLELRQGAAEQWAINTCFHFLRTIAAANDTSLEVYETICYDFVLAHDPSRFRHFWAELFYLFGRPAAILYSLLERWRFR